MNNFPKTEQQPVKLLIVDDEEDILEILRFNLENEGFAVDTATSGEEALERLTPQHRLILLDVMMDGMSGYHVAEQLRRQNIQTPIIFLTARDTENDMLTGFSVGADDYIAKPFSIKEVIARVKAVTRRKIETFPDHETNGDTIAVCGLKLDLKAKRIEIDGHAVILTKKEFEILSLLMQRQGEVFSRDDILREVWRDESFVQQRTVDVHVARLRRKIEPYGDCIANRAGYGYFFNPKAVETDENTA